MGILYGRGTRSVGEMLGISREEAQKLIDDFFNAYPVIKQYVEECQAKAKKNGYTETAWRKKKIFNSYSR